MDPLGLNLGSQGFKQAMEGMLAGRICCPSHEGSKPGDAGNGDNHTLSLNETLERGFSAVHRPEEVNFHHPAKDRDRGVPEKTDLGHTGIVD
jgi:hypothetical protein